MTAISYKVGREWHEITVGELERRITADGGYTVGEHGNAPYHYSPYTIGALSALDSLTVQRRDGYEGMVAYAEVNHGPVLRADIYRSPMGESFGPDGVHEQYAENVIWAGDPITDLDPLLLDLYCLIEEQANCPV